MQLSLYMEADTSFAGANIPSHRIGLRFRLLLVVCCWASSVTANTHPTPTPSGATDRVRTEDVWLSFGGETTFYFNPDRLRDMGLVLGNVQSASRIVPGDAALAYHQLSFPALNTSALELQAPGGIIQRLLGGSVQHRGGFVLNFADGVVDLRGFALRPRSGRAIGLEVVDRSGEVWFTMDHSHYQLRDRQTRLAMEHMNLRASAHLAEVLGHPEWVDMTMGGMDVQAQVLLRSMVKSQPPSCMLGSYPSAGLLTDIGLYQFTDGSGPEGVPDSIDSPRCNIGTSSCTSSSTTGQVVVAPDSSLINLGQTRVAWFEKFNRNQVDSGPPPIGEGAPQPPYNNDQHPFLVWNLYRIDSSGHLKQLGASGVKHAFYAVNWNCSCVGGHEIYPNCMDTYASSNNDTSGFLGPRSEIIPATGQWGRCMSVFDANCDGVQDVGGGAHDLHQYRLNALESDLRASLNPGAQYFFEYWYVVREDQNIYNTMGTRSVVPSKSGSLWFFDAPSAPAAGPLVSGPVINLWVSPTSPLTGTLNSELASPEGHARVAVKTTDLGAGNYHYEYVVQNLDFARAVIDPVHNTDDLTINPSGLRVLSNLGFNSFEIPVATGLTITNIQFADLDASATNDWSGTLSGNTVHWQAPAGNELNWGTLYRFSFDANHAPVTSSAQLGVANSGSPDTYHALTIAPTDLVFKSSFE